MGEPEEVEECGPPRSDRRFRCLLVIIDAAGSDQEITMITAVFLDLQIILVKAENL